MATSDFPVTLRSSLGRAGGRPNALAIDAHYYNITDIQAWPIAGLLVLMDGKGQPVRAELHLYDELPSHVQEAAMRQARLVLQEQYVGLDPVELRVLETQQMREAVEVRLPPPNERGSARRPVQWRPYAFSGLALVLVAALIWALLALWGPEPTAEPPAGAATAAAPGIGVVAEAAATGGVVAASVQPAAGDAAVALPVQDGALPKSRNARPELGIGMRVTIVPGLQLALRSQPGADAGIVVGVMRDGQVATIIGGPHMTQGDSDTIVWWLVELEDGAQAWAAANTSQQTLLMPVP